MTTMPIRREAEVKALLHTPDSLALATVMALGHPVRQIRRLTRTPVEGFTTVDTVDGPAFPAARQGRSGHDEPRRRLTSLPGAGRPRDPLRPDAGPTGFVPIGRLHAGPGLA